MSFTVLEGEVIKNLLLEPKCAGAGIAYDRKCSLLAPVPHILHHPIRHQNVASVVALRVPHSGAAAPYDIRRDKQGIPASLRERNERRWKRLFVARQLRPTENPVDAGREIDGSGSILIRPR